MDQGANRPQSAIGQKRSSAQTDHDHWYHRGQKRVAEILEDLFSILNALADLQCLIVYQPRRCDLEQSRISIGSEILPLSLGLPIVTYEMELFQSRGLLKNIVLSPGAIIRTKKDLR